MIDGRSLGIQVLLLAIAFALSSLIGYERQIRQKAAGLRTHTLVGVGAALFTLVSKWGFADVAAALAGSFDNVNLDPSRVAAQIVSGIGFIGGGLIFVRRDLVRGLTTASAVWLTAAVGMAAGAGMVVLAVAATALHFVAVVGYTYFSRRLPKAEMAGRLRMAYAHGSGALRAALVACTDHGFAVDEVSVAEEDDEYDGRAPLVQVSLQVTGTGSMAELTAELSELAGVRSVSVDESSQDD